jgi:tRNA (uracil-5-)-methyltransferase TRM9
MDSAIAQRLLALNRDFYERFGADFSVTRQRLQPGVTRLLETLSGDESILDLGCGNGGLARTLAKHGHHGSYLGVDFSLSLLREAEPLPDGFPAKFLALDLTQLSIHKDLLKDGQWSLITAFAVLHHIPSKVLRVDILKTIHTLLATSGRFIHSNWQFLESRKLRGRIQPWERIGLTGSDVDAGDHLLDWRRGGEGLRYVHQYTEHELAGLALECGFEMVESFHSDGEGGKLGLYQVWKPIEVGE